MRRQLELTPFPGEPVGCMIESAGEERLLFPSDPPHPEGGKDPIARFEASLGDASAAARGRFDAGS